MKILQSSTYFYVYVFMQLFFFVKNYVQYLIRNMYFYGLCSFPWVSGPFSKPESKSQVGPMISAQYISSPICSGISPTNTFLLKKLYPFEICSVLLNPFPNGSFFVSDCLSFAHQHQDQSQLFLSRTPSLQHLPQTDHSEAGRCHFVLQ